MDAVEVARASEDRGPLPGQVRRWSWRIFATDGDFVMHGVEEGRWDSADDAAYDVMSTWLAESGQSRAPGIVCRAWLDADRTVPYGEVDGADW